MRHVPVGTSSSFAHLIEELLAEAITTFDLTFLQSCQQAKR